MTDFPDFLHHLLGHTRQKKIASRPLTLMENEAHAEYCAQVKALAKRAKKLNREMEKAHHAATNAFFDRIARTIGMPDNETAIKEGFSIRIDMPDEEDDDDEPDEGAITEPTVTFWRDVSKIQPESPPAPSASIVAEAERYRTP